MAWENACPSNSSPMCLVLGSSSDPMEEVAWVCDIVGSAITRQYLDSIGIFIFHSVIVLSAQCRGESCDRPNQGDHKDRPYEKTI